MTTRNINVSRIKSRALRRATIALSYPLIALAIVAINLFTATLATLGGSVEVVCAIIALIEASIRALTVDLVKRIWSGQVTLATSARDVWRLP